MTCPAWALYGNLDVRCQLEEGHDGRHWAEDEGMAGTGNTGTLAKLSLEWGADLGAPTA